MNKKVKHYDQHKHLVKLEGLQKELKAYKELMQVIKSIDDNSNSVEHLSFRLREKSGFLNTELSYKAYNLDAEYNQIKQLEAKCTNINANDLNSKGEFKQSFLKQLREDHTTYFEPKELEQRQKLEKLMEDFNNLDLSTRHLCNFNYNKELHYHIYANLNI